MFNDSLQEIFRYGEKGRLFNEFNMPFFYRNCKLHEKDSLIQIYDLNLFHEKYLNGQLVNTAYDFINGRYLPSKLYFSENLNQIDNNTIIGNTIEMQHTGISYDNPIYIIDMYATPEYCYLLRANMPIEQLNATQDHPCQILIMDWEGNLKNVLQIPFFITPLVVNEDNTKLFSIYPNTSDPEYAYLVEFDI